MLLKQKPLGSNYVKIDDENINRFLQLMGYMPKYFWEGYFYYQEDNGLKNAINIYDAIKETEGGGE